MITSRRKFLIGAASLLAAPAIVRASSIMPVRPLPKRIIDITDPFLAVARRSILVPRDPSNLHTTQWDFVDVYDAPEPIVWNRRNGP